jgi:thiamine biosynthesis lipoprotein
MSSSLLLAGILLAASLQPQPFEAVEPHMGTLFRIKLYARDQAEAQRGFKAAFARIAALDDILSDYKSGSELNQLSVRAVGQPVRVSKDLFQVLSAAQELAEESGGAFDITLGPLTHLWRAARPTGQPPTESKIQAARQLCGFRKLHVDRERQTAELAQANMQLDVGGIAKGYAADQALQALGARGIHSALVAASGDLAFSDAPPGEAGWKIGVDSLDRASAPFTRVLLLSHAAVSTSGETEQHLDAGGLRYSHIIDPRTGIGLTEPRTVTVVAPRGVEADGLATAISVLGVQRGLDLLEAHPKTAALVLIREEGAARVYESKRFHTLPAIPPAR